MAQDSDEMDLNDLKPSQDKKKKTKTKRKKYNYDYTRVKQN